MSIDWNELSTDMILDAAFAVVIRRNEAMGLSEFTLQERNVYWLCLAHGAIGNGGFRNWYSSHAEMVPVMAAFESIGLPSIVAACQSSLEFFANSKPPTDRKERLNQMMARDGDAKRIWEAAETEVFKQWNDIPGRVATYVRNNINQIRDINDQIEIDQALRKIPAAFRRDWKRLRGAKRTVAAISRFIEREDLLVLFQYPRSINIALVMTSALEKIGLEQPARDLIAATATVAESGGLTDVDSPLDLKAASPESIGVLKYLNDELRRYKLKTTQRLAELLRSKVIVIR